MAWQPISGDLPQYSVSGEQASGYVLKFYEVGTTTPLTVASTSAGTPTTTDFLLDTQGYTTLSSVRVLPHVQTAYKLIMYLNQTDADADDTGSAVWTIDSISLAVGTNTTVDNVTDLAAVDVGEFQSAYVEGTSAIDDGGQSHFYYDAASAAVENGTTIITPDSVGAGSGRWLILNVETLALGDNSVTAPKWGYVPLNVKSGLLVSNNSGTPDEIIDIAAGEIGDTTKANLMQLGSAFTKTIASPFAVGTGNGGLSDDDSLVINTWYGVWLLSKVADPTDCDVIIATTKAKSLSDAAATTAGFDISRLIDYVRTDGTSDILPFIYNGNNTRLWEVPIDSGVSTAVTTRADIIMVAPPFQAVTVCYSIAAYGATSTAIEAYGILTQVDQTDTAPTNLIRSIWTDVRADGNGSNPLRTGSSVITSVKTNSASRISHRESANANVAGMQSLGYTIDYSITDLV